MFIDDSFLFPKNLQKILKSQFNLPSCDFFFYNHHDGESEANIQIQNKDIKMSIDLSRNAKAQGIRRINVKIV